MASSLSVHVPSNFWLPRDSKQRRVSSGRRQCTTAAYTNGVDGSDKGQLPIERQTPGITVCNDGASRPRPISARTYSGFLQIGADSAPRLFARNWLVPNDGQ